MKKMLGYFAACMILWALIDLAALVLVDWDPTREAVFAAELCAAVAALILRSQLK